MVQPRDESDEERIYLMIQSTRETKCVFRSILQTAGTPACRFFFHTHIYSKKVSAPSNAVVRDVRVQQHAQQFEIRNLPRVCTYVCMSMTTYVCIYFGFWAFFIAGYSLHDPTIYMFFGRGTPSERPRTPRLYLHLQCSRAKYFAPGVEYILRTNLHRMKHRSRSGSVLSSISRVTTRCTMVVGYLD